MKLDGEFGRPALLLIWAAITVGCAAPAVDTAPRTGVFPEEQGYVDANGALIWYMAVGQGDPLVLLHGGPGASHDYLLPGLLPLARHHRLVFIDERGSGRSERLEDAKLYTVEAMVEDLEAVRRALGLGKIDLLGHSYGGVLAQAYALEYQDNLKHLVLCSTFHSTAAMNRVFQDIKAAMAPDLRERIDAMEREGLFGHGLDYEKNRYTDAYAKAAWGEGYFPYLFRNRPNPNYDPSPTGLSWELYREMWGSNGEFVIDGNLASVEYADRLPSLHVPTQINVGDHDECAPSLAETMHELIPDSELVIFPDSGHLTFIDQPTLFVDAVEKFLER